MEALPLTLITAADYVTDTTWQIIMWLSTFEIILPQNEITMLTFLFIVDYLTTAHVCFDIPIFRLLCIVHVSHNFIPSVAKWSTNVYCGRNWLVDYILFHVSLENISFIWRTSWRYKKKPDTWMPICFYPQRTKKQDGIKMSAVLHHNLSEYEYFK